MRIFLIRLYYVIWVACVKAVFYFMPSKKTAVVGQQSMKVKNGKLFFCIKQNEPKANKSSSLWEQFEEVKKQYPHIKLVKADDFYYTTNEAGENNFRGWPGLRKWIEKEFNSAS